MEHDRVIFTYKTVICNILFYEYIVSLNIYGLFSTSTTYSHGEVLVEVGGLGPHGCMNKITKQKREKNLWVLPSPSPLGVIIVSHLMEG